MKFKRLALSLAAMLAIGAAAQAEVTVKSIDAATAEVTFTYKDDAATEMNVIGSFDGWTVPGEPMTKNAAGLWEYRLKAAVSDEIQYKFYYKGTWIFDFKAPDKKDDGFGGNNGLIVVADLLAGGGSKAGAASGPVLPGRKKISFGTTTFVESDTAFDTAAWAFEPSSSSLLAKSVWKFGADFAPGMPGYIELTFFDGESAIWRPDDPATAGTDESLSLVDGLKGLASGLIFDPAFYLGGNTRPKFGGLRFGFDSPYLVYETGYAGAYFPEHDSVLWSLVSSETQSGYGYGSFRLGPALRDAGGLSLDAAIVPNRILSGGAYGLFSYAKAAMGDYSLEAIYEARASTAALGDPRLMFKGIPRQDLVLGLQAYPGQVGIKGQFLYSMYAANTSYDLSPFADKVGAEVRIDYADFFEIYALSLGFRYRGQYGQLLYASPDTVLGAGATQTLSLGGWMKLGHWVTAKAKAAATLPTDLSAFTMADLGLRLTPGLGLDFSVPARRPLTADLYGIVDVAPGSTASPLAFYKAGAKLSVGALAPGFVDSVDLYYGLDNSGASMMFHSLLAEAKLGGGLVAQAGFGLRSGAGVANPYGALVGLDYAVALPKSPVLYAQFVWNMDPFDPDERTVYKFDGDYAYLPAGGASVSDGKGAFRLGLTWAF